MLYGTLQRFFDIFLLNILSLIKKKGMYEVDGKL